VNYRRQAQIDNRRSALLIALVLAFLVGVGVGGATHTEPQPTATYYGHS
jgi:hypothetical protein